MANKPKSTGTGRFIICYGATVRDHQVYLEIKQGPSGKYFVHCPLCGLKAFFNRQFWWDVGMRSDEVRKERHYMHIIAAAPAPPTRELPATGGSGLETTPTPRRARAAG